MIKNISNLGDAALYCDFGNKVDQKTNIKVIKYFENIKKQNIYGINNLTPSYNKLIISFDLNILNFTELKKKIEDIKVSESEFKQNQKIIKIPTCCDDEFALDFDRLEQNLRISKDEILKNLRPNKKQMLKLANIGYLTSTDLADYLVRNHSIVFAITSVLAAIIKSFI